MFICLINKRIFCLLSITLFLLASLVFARHVVAQSTFTYALRLPVSDAEATVGDIISRNRENALVRSTQSFDDRMIGVFQENASIVFQPSEPGSTIITTGRANVRVTTLAGPIKKGDYITSSSLPGYGQKAGNLAGYMLGTALSSFAEGDGDTTTFEEKTISTGIIPVFIQIGPVVPTRAGFISSLTDQLASLIFSNVQTPKQNEKFFRYVIATFVVILTTTIGFRAFGRGVIRGIEAIGRNPLAKAQIQTMVVINASLVVGIVLGGIVFALAIIRF